MMKNSLLILLAAFALFFCSCSSYRKIPYFQDLKYTSANKEVIDNFTPLTIQPSDILSVSVSSLNPMAYNDSTGRTAGYLVNQEGMIKLPLIGAVKVAGLTTPAAEQQIQKQLVPFLKNPDVVVRMMNFKVAVLGDVAKPDVYKVASERITVTEAISMAGDLNITAKRNNILLVREIDGEREYLPIDLTSAEVFKLPHYYLKNNDIIYVQPDKTKYASVDGKFQTLSLVLSGLSIVAIILANAL